MGLWVFLTAVTVGDALKWVTADAFTKHTGTPGNDYVVALQRENMLSGQYLGSRDSGDLSALLEQRTVVDDKRDTFLKGATRDDVPEAMRPVYDEVISVANNLRSIRERVDAGQADLVRLSDDFGRLPDLFCQLADGVTVTLDSSLYQQAHAFILVGQARDAFTREASMGAAALAAHRPFTPLERRAFTRLADTRIFLIDQGLAQMAPNLRAPLFAVLHSPDAIRFQQMEEQLVAQQNVSQDSWRAVSDRLQSAWHVAEDGSTAALNRESAPTAINAFLRAGAAGLIGLLAVIGSVLLTVRLARGLSRELGALRDAAQDLATVRLPRVVARLKQGDQVDVAAEAPPIEPAGSTEEVRDVAAAFDSVQRTAVEAAVEQAVLRESVGGALRNLARRSQSLVQRQLRMLDEMQRDTDDPIRLDELFRLDHLTTRMRRHAEGLIVLSGGSAGRVYRQPVHLEDVLRAAVAEVEAYTRVTVYPMSDSAVPGTVVADLIHLFAELVENAAVYSPPHTEVTVRGDLVARGFAVEVEDRGLGLKPDELERINRRLAEPPEFNPADTDRLGLVVAGRLAARHHVQVELRRSPFGGVSAIVLLPAALLVKEEARLEVTR
ncbi:nitrate- and nitrite sensing domain-containing protein [Streptosporangiaceae bacterium NEAU-GS5]|nr:nitrate- and nitrite sensing domain-containing protein [Streptosporangiaceae bacterium NEAU-GS5]